MQKEFHVGDHVRHKRYGIGIVKHQWGCFFSCRECFRELPKHQLECNHCRKATILLSVNGREIYDVKFGREIKSRAIHQCWLKKI